MLRTSSEFEADIIALADCLRELSIGGVVTYADLDKRIGRPIRAQRYLLAIARDRVECETGALFQSVFNRGIKRLPVESFATVGQKSRSSIRKKARTASKRMQNGINNTNDVPAEVLRAVSREQSVLGLIQYAAKEVTFKKMLADEPITAPTPLARAAKDLLAALGVQVDD